MQIYVYVPDMSSFSAYTSVTYVRSYVYTHVELGTSVQVKITSQTLQVLI